MKKLNYYFLFGAMACAAFGNAWAQENKPPEFEKSLSCDSIKGFDPAWSSYGNNYGQDWDDSKFSGFYQIAERDGLLYAAFGGALIDNLPAPGATPGALVIVNAETLAFEKAIALPFQAHALALVPGKQRAIVTHTRANAFSIVDLETGEVACRKADTRFGDVKEYKGRHVAADAEGNFYISYYSGWREPTTSVVMKYDDNGEHDQTFQVLVTEPNMSLPLFSQGGQLITGAKGVKSVSMHTGEIVRLSPEERDRNIFNYAAGPGNTLLGTDHNYRGAANLLLFNTEHNGHSTLFTGSGTLEVAYSPDSEHAFATNYGSGTLSVIPLQESARALEPGRFVNIVLGGSPVGLAVRHTEEATEAFVTPKWWDDVQKKGAIIHKVRIAGFVNGIDGITKPGACTVQTFDMRTNEEFEPQPCEILDARATYRDEVARGQRYLQSLLQQRQSAEDELRGTHAAIAVGNQGDVNKDGTDAAAKQVAALERALSSLSENIRDVEAALEVGEQLVSQ